MRPISALALALTLVACRNSPYAAAAKADTVEAYRKFLRENPKDEDVESAQARLAELEFVEASKLHTLVAYKRFLEQHPDSSQTRAALARLEALRFNAASQRGTAVALKQFLLDHPAGAHAADATALLSKVEGETLAHSQNPSELARTIAGRPDDPRRAEAEVRLEARAFEEAKASGATKLLAYLREHPSGTHREDARIELLSLELESLLFSGELEEARARAKASPLSSKLPNLAERFQKAEAERALGRSRDPLARSAQVGHYVRSLEDLVSALHAPDPLDRWQAAEELGQHVSIKAIDPLLDALRSSRSPLVRQRAFEGLGQVMAALPPAVREYAVASRLEVLRQTASDDEMYLRVAVLLDLSGQLELAATEYQRAFVPDAPDPVVLRRWSEIRRERSQFFSAAVASRQLAKWALDQARAADVSGEGSALAEARQLCAAGVAARYAAEIIAEARARKTEFPEDLEEFAARAEESRRLTAARLKDAELLLRTQQPHARSCDDRQVTDRLVEAERSRIEVLSKLPKKVPHLAPQLLDLAKRHDPSPRVRAEAAKLTAVLPGPVKS